MQRKFIVLIAFVSGLIGVTIPLVVKRREVRAAIHKLEGKIEDEFSVNPSRYGYDFNNPAPYYGD